ncbi:hypothetical protein [Pseudomonas putida]|uniref:Uncharacterized protein n=1 Tax=Pseudomonas putida TaxID=303 RepID=A0A8I1EEY0_PSEPU|nr:hypothetical protein [Pseudomonas putida]MBI6883983.1 hypothetical protein [Pseudomonas putida]
MQKSDFDFDRDGFPNILGRNHRGLGIAQRQLWETMGSWEQFAPNLLGGKVTVAIGQLGERVIGRVLDKNFYIDFGVFADDSVAAVEAVVSVPKLSDGTPAEIARFLFAPGGKILSSQKETLWDGDEDFLSYELLIAIVRKVTQAPLVI